MNIATYTKENPAVTDFQIDWTVWLEGRTITSSSWSVSPSGITTVADSNTTTVATIRLSGGTWGETYIATNHIIASDSEEEERSITIKIQQEQKYCSPTEVRRRMFGGPTGSATTAALTDAELDALIEQASRHFDLVCGLTPGYFNPPAFPFATTQTIYGDGTNYLKLPPYVAGSLSSTITLPDGYTAPSFVAQNGFLVLSTSTGGLPPFSWFPSWPNGWYSGIAVAVTAIWGFESTPPDVKEAVIELIINLVRETDPATVKLVNIEGQPLREKLPPRVADIARRYRATSLPAFL